MPNICLLNIVKGEDVLLSVLLFCHCKLKCLSFCQQHSGKVCFKMFISFCFSYCFSAQTIHSYSFKSNCRKYFSLVSIVPDCFLFQRHTFVCRASSSAPGSRNASHSTCAATVRTTVAMEKTRQTAVRLRISTFRMLSDTFGLKLCARIHLSGSH